MAAERTAAEIMSRFATEQDYIQKYVDFLQVTSAIRDQQILELNGLLKRNALPELRMRDYDRTEEPFIQEEVAALLESIRTATPAVVEATKDKEKRLDRLPLITATGPGSEHPDLLGEWIDYMMEHLSGEPSPEEIEGLRRYAIREALQLEDQDEDITPQEIEYIINDAIDTAVHIKGRQRVGGLQYALEWFERLQLLARIATPDAEISLLRQGFILLMTAFDAAIFDLVRVAFRKRFFDLLPAFGADEKYALKRIGALGSFEAFRDAVIEEQLKRYYLKDVLAILQRIGVQCVDEGAGRKFVHLVELVLRRNLHVHNRGIVDERYLERDDKGTPRYNLYNLNLNDPAPIDQDYWEVANWLCTECVNRVAEWAAG